MTIHTKVSGVWKEITDPSVNVSSTWKDITEGYVRVSGVWKQFFEAFTVTLDASGYPEFGNNLSNGPCGAGVSVYRDGNIKSGSSNSSQTFALIDVGGTPNEWADPESSTIGDGYHVRMVTSTGSFTVGTADTWLALTSDRDFKNTRASPGSSFWTGKMQISGDGGSTVAAETGVLNITATSETP